MTNLRQIIIGVGYGDNEARVYIASLELGEATITDLSNKAGIPRTTCQHAIRLLQQHGLMNYYVKRRRKYWIAENPQKMITRLEGQEGLLKTILPKLQAMHYAAEFRPTARIFHGIKEVRQIFDDIIETKQHIRSLTAVEIMSSLFEEVFTDFIFRRHQHHLRVQLLTNSSPFSEQLSKNDEKELRQTRFLPPSIKLKNATFIYGRKTAIISLSKSLVTGIIIEDPEFSATQDSIFYYLWDKSSVEPPSRAKQ